ncbi:MAG: NUDIX hydrolase [Bdellovibrionales bacterium]|nr:NUDIX hydrolase [Bdellovibrionales bacterium]
MKRQSTLIKKVAQNLGAESIKPGFNVRVYGILIDAQEKKLLILDEKIQGQRLIKFPGGGVEYLEAPEQALKREFIEELNLNISLGPLFFVSKKFYRSFFRPQQLIGIYWQVQVEQGVPEAQNPHCKLLWRPLHELTPMELTHPQDQEVAQIVIEKFKHP